MRALVRWQDGPRRWTISHVLFALWAEQTVSKMLRQLDTLSRRMEETP